MSMKNPLILAGIEPATFRFVAPHLNHCDTAVPRKYSTGEESHEQKRKEGFLFFLKKKWNSTQKVRRSQWPRGLMCGTAAARLLGFWVRIPPGAWMSVCCECCVLSGRRLCDELITRTEESYRLWCVVECDLENL
jgi:hypothetical protein